MRSRSWSSKRVERRAGVPGFILGLCLKTMQQQASNPLMQNNFQGEPVPRISRTDQLFRQNLRDTLRRLHTYPLSQ